MKLYNNMNSGYLGLEIIIDNQLLIRGNMDEYKDQSGLFLTIAF